VTDACLLVTNDTSTLARKASGEVQNVITLGAHLRVIIRLANLNDSCVRRTGPTQQRSGTQLPIVVRKSTRLTDV